TSYPLRPDWQTTRLMPPARGPSWLGAPYPLRMRGQRRPLSTWMPQNPSPPLRARPDLRRLQRPPAAAPGNESAFAGSPVAPPRFFAALVVLLQHVVPLRPAGSAPQPAVLCFYL